MSQIERILFATDFSDCSERALVHAVNFAQQHGATLTVVHVVQVPDPYGPYEAWAFNRSSVEAELIEESVKHIRKSLEGRAATGVEITPKAITGIPSRAITDFARAENFDLIVVGTHGRGALGHLVMGSVAERVIRNAPCPVLTVPPGTPAPEDG